MKNIRNEQVYTYSEVINRIVQDGISTFRKKGSRAALGARSYYEDIEKQYNNRKGVQFVVRKKGDLSRKEGVKGYIVTSQEALMDEANVISHWTPNVYRYGTYVDEERKFIKGHSEENLQQINTFVIDIDTQAVDLAKIIAASIKVLNQAPSVILKTDKGFQVYLVLEAPCYISNINNFKSLRVAKRISRNLKHAFSQHLPAVDLGCNDFGFFRAPNFTNIIFENIFGTFEYSNLIAWSKQYSIENNKPGLKLVQDISNMNFHDVTNQKWYQDLASLTNIKGHKGQYGRNNTIFTLALACFAAGKSYEEAYNELDVFNSNLETAVSKREFEKCLTNAYSGKYNGADLEKVAEILQVYSNVDYKISYSNAFIYDNTGKVKPQFYRKHKKERTERKYSHIHEWENDLEQYIENNVFNGQVFIEKAQRELAEELQMPHSTLKVILKKSRRIIKKVTGRGRAAKTLFSTAALVVEQAIRCAIEKKKAQSEQYIEFAHTFQDAANFVNQFFNEDTTFKGTGSYFLRSLNEIQRINQGTLELLSKVYRRQFDDGLPVVRELKV
ncbi:primase C-terminal domain-containing protein [Listeria seeligeri]|uniref:primase C-terminal domain-containing protein n=1 Tax=Listeria seeligeri TaxID=1640 RepID=UPI0016248145|nr:primase C-terminal domain-containing protein [Listeria seeligeri]MBC1557001.1 plasmid replication protein [Listeria seeligeri]HAB0718279.1 plasmid replication protein [Listeria monocytogenes]